MNTWITFTIMNAQMLTGSRVICILFHIHVNSVRIQILVFNHGIHTAHVKEVVQKPFHMGQISLWNRNTNDCFFQKMISLKTGLNEKAISSRPCCPVATFKHWWCIHFRRKWYRKEYFKKEHLDGWNSSNIPTFRRTEICQSSFMWKTSSSCFKFVSKLFPCIFIASICKCKCIHSFSTYVVWTQKVLFSWKAQIFNEIFL